MRLGLMGTTDDGKRAATLLGTGALCAATYLIDILCAGLNDPGSAALTANVALPLDLMVVALLAFWITYVRPRGKSLTTASPIIRYEVPSQDAQPYREGELLRRQGLCGGLRACCPEATFRDGVGHVTGMSRACGTGGREWARTRSRSASGRRGPGARRPGPSAATTAPACVLSS